MVAGGVVVHPVGGVRVGGVSRGAGGVSRGGREGSGDVGGDRTRRSGGRRSSCYRSAPGQVRLGNRFQ